MSVTAPNIVGAEKFSGRVMAAVGFEAVAGALDAGELPCSGGEGQMLRLAASIAGGVPVDLGGAVSGLDAANIGLVTVEGALPLVSPAYDLGLAEDAIRAAWWSHYAALQNRAQAETETATLAPTRRSAGPPRQ